MPIARTGFSSARKNCRALLLALVMTAAASPVYASSSGFSSLSDTTPFAGTPSGTNTPVTVFTTQASTLTTSFAGPVLLSGALGINIGSTVSPGTNSELQINGGAAIGYSTSTAVPANGMLISGYVGIGTASPQSQLDIAVSNWSPNAGIHILTPSEDEYALMINNSQYGNTNATGFGFWESNTGTAGIDVNKNHAIFITPAALVGIGSSVPQGTLDVESGVNGASLCMNGNCVNQLPSTVIVTLSKLAKYNNLCTGTGVDSGGAILGGCVSACNRYCSNACSSGGLGCTGTQNSGLNYVAGTMVEDNGTNAECACF